MVNCRWAILWYFGWRVSWIRRSMLVFREAKKMPVQQILVNPVTLQQTNNKDKKVRSALNLWPKEELPPF